MHTIFCSRQGRPSFQHSSLPSLWPQFSNIPLFRSFLPSGFGPNVLTDGRNAESHGLFRSNLRIICHLGRKDLDPLGLHNLYRTLNVHFLPRCSDICRQGKFRSVSCPKQEFTCEGEAAPAKNQGCFFTLLQRSLNGPLAGRSSHLKAHVDLPLVPRACGFQILVNHV
jgi:hypothetical protein